MVSYAFALQQEECLHAYLAYMICNAISMWDKACCLATFPSSDKRIFAREGRFGLEQFVPLILLLAAEESASEGTPKKRQGEREGKHFLMV